MAALTYLMLVVCVGYISGEMVDVRPYKALLLDLHNDYRRKVQPPAANMQVMVWNETLSNEAALWIRGCNFEHQRKGRGENLAYSSMKYTTDVYIAEALKSWYDERKLYWLGPQACGNACHYTQMVWYKTTQVGCAMFNCSSLNAFGRSIQHAWYLGCFYDPKGNWIGETPYEKGTPCSKCLGGQTCDEKLCTGEGEEVCEDEKDRCKEWKAMGECNRNPNYMARHCRLSCGICKAKGPAKQVCSDTDDSCAMWAQRGECEKNKAWMIPNCPKSCRACSGGDENVGGNESGSGRGSGSGGNRDDNQVVNGTLCENNSPLMSCRAWSRSGACASHPQYMSKECRRECGLCPDETVCSDKIQCCAGLRRRGYCRRYRKFMRENCKASCSQC